MSLTDFSVCTFNILAPCYKRLSSEYDRESRYESIWQLRHLSIIELLQTLQINVICLQEFWLTEPKFSHLYESRLSSKYSFHYVRRTQHCSDGLAILVERNVMTVRDKHDFILNDVGNRVGVLLNIEFNGRCLLIINIHLTFPHNSFDRTLRLQQINKFITLIDEYQVKHDLVNKCSIIFCGDFNSAFDNDPVYQFVTNHYRSSYLAVHGKEPKFTHLTHRNEQLAVDFIFYKSDSLRPISSELIPQDCNEQIGNDSSEWTLSDHRGVLTKFRYDNAGSFRGDL